MGTIHKVACTNGLLSVNGAALFFCASRQNLKAYLFIINSFLLSLHAIMANNKLRQ